MSINTTIKFRDTAKEETFIGVSTQKTFHDYWQPIAQKLQLEWVILMGTAGLVFPLYQDELQNIIGEFEQFQEYLEKDQSSEWLREHTIEIVTKILDHLKAIQAHPETILEAALG